MSSYLSFPSPDSRAWLFLPAASMAAASVASRAATGMMGIGSKALSSVTHKLGMENIGKNLDAAGDKLIGFATRSPKSEIRNITLGLLAGGIGYGATELMTKPSGGVFQSTPSWEKFTSSICAYKGVLSGLFAGGHLSTISLSSASKAELNTIAEDKIAHHIDLTKGDYTGFRKKNEEGEWVPHGQGTFIAEDGTMYVGQFENGKFIDGIINESNKEIPSDEANLTRFYLEALIRIQQNMNQQAANDSTA